MEFGSGGSGGGEGEGEGVSPNFHNSSWEVRVEPSSVTTQTNVVGSTNIHSKAELNG